MGNVPLSAERRDTAEVSALDMAADTYYWKPAAAWFRALELTEYLRLDLRLPPPVLDLGCGDGKVSLMLGRLGRLGEAPLGADTSSRQLYRAARLGVHEDLVRADAGRLPFPDGAFRSVLCNGLICSIPHDFRSALREIRRVLEPGGRAAISVPTDRFNDMLIWPRILRRVSPGLSGRYERAIDARQPHYWKLTPEGWRRELENAGLEVVGARSFFRRSEGTLYNLLYMHVLRIFGILRLLDGPLARRIFGPLVAGLLRSSFARATRVERHAGDDAGYVLLDARRT